MYEYTRSTLEFVKVISGHQTPRWIC